MPGIDDFGSARAWVDQILTARETVASLLLALEPFTPFVSRLANELLILTDQIVADAADAIETGCSMTGPVDALLGSAGWWDAREVSGSDANLWLDGLQMSSAPMDEHSEFRADWVFQHFAYRNRDLLKVVIPHLQSLGIGGVTDPLAAVQIVGWILSCDDAAAAYVSMTMFVQRSLASEPAVLSSVREHLEASEPAMRKTREAIGPALAKAASSHESLEARGIAMVDAYRRMIEGPFRQFSWALYCLRQGEWSMPPMLSELSDRIMAAGGNLASITRSAVLIDVRNSEAHETLVWDGFAEEFITEKGRVHPQQIAEALILANTLSRGGEAGLAAIRALDLTDSSPLLPAVNEVGRMPSWRRVRAFFGTNRLRLVEAHLNSNHAFLRLARLAVTDINPCFQALVLAHRLIPEIENFSVATTQSSEPLVVVSAEAIIAAMPVWELAVSALDRLPLAAFLPMNLNARVRIESTSIAERSVAWIAVDDAVGSIDGSPLNWDRDDVALLSIRLGVVQIAIDQTLKLIGHESLRLQSVLTSVRALRTSLLLRPTTSRELIDRDPALATLRAQWEQWGPVQRHPLVSEDYAPDASYSQPAFLGPLGPLGPNWYRTL
ncbi:MAG: hypothetical protein ACYCZY_10055 [Lacisediminihabitans sp.]